MSVNRATLTAGALKESLSASIGVSVEQLRLVYKSQPMNDSKTLGDNGVTAGSTVHLILQLIGG